MRLIFYKFSWNHLNSIWEVFPANMAKTSCSYSYYPSSFVIKFIIDKTNETVPYSLHIVLVYSELNQFELRMEKNGVNLYVIHLFLLPSFNEKYDLQSG